MTSGWIQDGFRMTKSTQRVLRKHLDSNQRALREHQRALRALREHLKSTQRAREQSDFFIPSEPKILRLVLIAFIEMLRVV